MKLIFPLARTPRSARRHLSLIAWIACAHIIGLYPGVAAAVDAGLAVWPATANLPANLGGTIDGKYTDRNGKVFDGTGYTVVDIDGAFRPDNPSFTTAAGRNKIIAEACFGQPAGSVAWPSLCKHQTFVSRPLAGNPSAGYYFSSLPGDSMPSDSPDNTCRQTDSSGQPGFCHYYHGTVTSGVMVGQPRTRTEVDATFTYTGVAPGANVIALKIGGGTGTDGAIGWPINSVVDALNYVHNGLLARTDIGPSIVAVNISSNGSSAAGDLPCGANSEGARIDEIAGKLRAKGVAVLMSAGNDAVNGTGSWTCGSNVIPVGASDILAPTEPTTYSNVSQRVSLFAPVGIGDRASRNFVLVPWSGNGALHGSFYPWGTSFAAPQVAGAFAVLRQKFGKTPSVDSLVALMQATGKPLTGSRAGLANSRAAVLNIGAALDGAPN
ncbi:Subtilase family protein [Caballeronia pedi]|uniref:Subtilase family protein n=1 Tax=Caballeronia pedi TaxID=1777141 RepID=A0A157ZEV6_9BURK|nr:S8 family serine peptidase [Caballeronia pedi]SAK44050.1 Subtilase family protein [Caballeronia pedi]